MFCYVILHYLTANDTIECVESILKLNEECMIIIVDNASNNGSIEKVSRKYENLERIIILKNKTNLGFASGNNVGYQFAKKRCNADFIAVLNNDIVVETDHFIRKVRETFKNSSFHLAGPDIVSLIDSQHQNPMMAKSNPTCSEIAKSIWRYRLLLLLSRLNVYDLLKHFHSKEHVLLSNNSVKRDNVQLHGSFIIFSPLYINREDYAFRPGTFLYMEESILYNYCKKKSYVTKFIPEIRVYHKEDSSTNALHSASKEKREFVFKNMIQSLKVYYKVTKDER